MSVAPQRKAPTRAGATSSGKPSRKSTADSSERKPVTPSHTRPRIRKDGSVGHQVIYRRDDGTQPSRSFNTAAGAADFADLLARLGWQEAEAIVDAQTSNARGPVPLVEDWFEHHLAHATGITDGTIAEYRRLAARTWMPVLGMYPINAVTRDHIARWMRGQAKALTVRGTPTSSKTIANAHGLLSTVLAAAVEAGHRPDNPSKGLRLPRGQKAEMTFLTEGEFATLLAHVDEYWRPLVAFLAGTGMRWGEATALQWQHLDLDVAEPTARVAVAWKRGAGVGAGDATRVLGVPKTRRSLRTVGLPGQIADMLRPMRGKPFDLVFTAPRGGPVLHQNFYPRVWRTAVDRAHLGKQPRIHDLRHSHASWLIAAGIPLPVIQRNLGHESIQTTVDVYGHLSNNARSLAAAAVTAALAGALPDLDVEAGQELVALPKSADVAGRLAEVAGAVVVPLAVGRGQ